MVKMYVLLTIVVVLALNVNSQQTEYKKFKAKQDSLLQAFKVSEQEAFMNQNNNNDIDYLEKKSMEELERATKEMEKAKARKEINEYTENALRYHQFKANIIKNAYHEIIAPLPLRKLDSISDTILFSKDDYRKERSRIKQERRDDKITWGQWKVLKKQLKLTLKVGKVIKKRAQLSIESVLNDNFTDVDVKIIDSLNYCSFSFVCIDKKGNSDWYIGSIAKNKYESIISSKAGIEVRSAVMQKFFSNETEKNKIVAYRDVSSMRIKELKFKKGNMYYCISLIKVMEKKGKKNIK